MENQLPSFWSASLSTVFGTANVDQTGVSGGAKPRRGQPASIESKRQKAQQMRAAGYSYSEIAKTLGISKSYAHKLTNTSM